MSASEISLPVPDVQPAHVHGPRLTGVGRKAGIGVWVVIGLVSLGLFFMALDYWFEWDSTPILEYVAQHPDQNLDTKQTAENIATAQAYDDAIHQLGMSLPFYGGLFAALRLLAALPSFLLSFLIMRRRSDRLLAVLFAIWLVVFGATGRALQPNWLPLQGWYPWTKFPILLLGFLLNCGAMMMFYAFPDGRFVPRWTRWLVLVMLPIYFFNIFFPDSLLNLDRLPYPVNQLPFQLPIMIGVFSLIYRYLRRADAEQKQQIKWVVLGAGVIMIAYYVHYLVFNTSLIGYIYENTSLLKGINLTGWPFWLKVELATEPPWYVAQALVAVCIGISVFRYRLWEIDLVINRLLVYGSLTLLVIGAYLAAVAALGSVFQSVTGPAPYVLVTGIIAILFDPLRRRLQRLVNHLMYGERDEPYAVLTRLAGRLEHSATPGEMLPAIATTVGQALKIPYVAILTHENGADNLVARAGKIQEDVLSFPLIYQSEVIGALRVGRRARGEEFSKADRRLLENIALQAGAAVQAVRLNAALVRSRAEIVSAREEERCRLRRDLHDGLGPILASQTLKMAAVRQLLRQNPGRAETMVDDIIQQNENTVSEVRRLVYGLRPPALDELGLVEAVRDLVRRSQPGSQSITVEGPEGGLPKMPAAVEANAYRIALEGLTNAARHAQAQHCTIRFVCQEIKDSGPCSALLVQISDDGVGMPEQYRAGVGIRSMRERAEELGGQLSISPVSPHGTLISAWLPLVEWK